MGFISDAIHSIGESTGLNDIVDAASNAVHDIGEATGLDKIGDAIGDSPVLQAAATAVATYYGMPWLAEQIGASMAGYTATTAATTAEAEAALQSVATAASAAGATEASISAAAASAGLNWGTIASGVASVAGVASGTLTGEKQAAAIKAASKAQLEAATTAEEKANIRAQQAAQDLKAPSAEYIKQLTESNKKQYDSALATAKQNKTITQNALTGAKNSLTTAYTQALTQLQKSQDAINAQRQANKQTAKDMLTNNDLAIQTISANMQKWDNTFGPVLDNLSDFYTNMTAQQVSGQQLTIQAQEFQNTKDTLLKSFAQRGIVAGSQQAMLTQAELDNARQRTAIRAEAPFKVAEAQQGFLASTAGITNPYADDYTNALNNKNATLSAINQQQMSLLSNQMALNSSNANLATDFGNTMAGFELSKANMLTNANSAISTAEQNFQAGKASIAETNYNNQRDITGLQYNVAQQGIQNTAAAQQYAAMLNSQANIAQAKTQAGLFKDVINLGLKVGGLS